MANVSQIIGATTAAVSVAKTISNISPANAIQGITDSITNTVEGIGKDIKNLITGVTDIGNIFSSINVGVVESDLALPLPNVLHDYATYNYIIGIGCLDPDSYNYPGSSYMVGKLPPLICKSANSDPSNRILLDGGKFDFYIDNLIINSYVGFSSQSGNTTNNTFTFTIIVQIAAYEQGYKNWNDANYLMTIEFRGNTETGAMVKVPDSSKFITFKFNTMNMRVTEAGCVYSIEAYASNNYALNDSVRTTKTDVTISGKTVQEVLQSGPKSLQQVVNDFYKKQKNDKIVTVPDEILILFPNNIATSGGGATLVAPGNTENSQSATTDPSNSTEQKLYEMLGVSRSSSTSELTQIDGTCNALGKASVGFDVTKGGNPPFPDENAVWEQGKGWVKADVCAAPNYTDFKFQQNSDVVNIINQVLMRSQAATVALDPNQISEEGMRPWWRIDTQVYHIASNENMKTTGQLPKLIVYRVVPYQVHASRLLPPNATAPGLTKLKNQVVKEYNYIYTGKNIDILKFDIEFNQAFYQTFSADNFKRTGDAIAKQQIAMSMDKTPAQEQSSAPVVAKGLEESIDASSAKYDSTQTSSDKKGGSIGDTPAVRAAKLFHDAIINSNDMQNLNMEIIGDPYYIASSGTGNHTETQLSQFNITADGSMNYQNGEVHIVVNFRSPTDLNEVSGMYDLKNNNLCTRFSGIYKVNTVKSEFKNGQFTQTLEGFRIKGQNNKEEADIANLFSTELIPDINNGLNIPGVSNAVKEISSFIESLPIIGK